MNPSKSNTSTEQQTFIKASSMGPTPAFRIAAIIALLTGTIAYLIGLFNAEMALNEKGYYFAVLLYGLFAVVSLQKTVRDQIEGIPTSKIYYILSWVSTAAAIALLVVGLYNAELFLSEKGFFGMAYTLSIFAAITVQKNVRDSQSVAKQKTDSSNAEKVAEKTDLEQHDKLGSSQSLFKSNNQENETAVTQQ